MCCLSEGFDPPPTLPQCASFCKNNPRPGAAGVKFQRKTNADYSQAPSDLLTFSKPRGHCLLLNINHIIS